MPNKQIVYGGIGVLMPFSEADAEGKLELAGFAHQLQDLGWTDGRNLRIDYRWAAGNPERMQTLAKELIALQPDVLFCRSTPVTGALCEANSYNSDRVRGGLRSGR